MVPWVIYTHLDTESLLEEAKCQEISKCPTIIQYFSMANERFKFNLDSTCYWRGLVYHNVYNETRAPAGSTFSSNRSGYYNWHRDEKFDKLGPHRKISFVMQLTDPNEYKGGDFEFDSDVISPEPSLLKPKGTIIVFPSYIKHRAAPVTKGRRESLAAWVEGPGFK